MKTTITITSLIITMSILIVGWSNASNMQACEVHHSTDWCASMVMH